MNRRPTALLLAVPLLALTAACGASSGGAAEGGGAAAAAAPQDAQIRYARCMRENGVPDMPDALPESGYTVKDMNAFEKARRACSKLENEAHGFDPLDPEVFDGRVRYAACMRGKGLKVHDPDPSTGGYRVEVQDTDRKRFEDAVAVCREHLSPKETGR